MKTNILRSLVVMFAMLCSLLIALAAFAEPPEVNQLSQKTGNTDSSERRKTAESREQINLKAVEALIAVATDNKGDLEARTTALKSLEAVLSKADKEVLGLAVIGLSKAAKPNEIIEWVRSLVLPVIVVIVGFFISLKLERARSGLATQLEGIKADFGAKFHARSARYNKEFQVYECIWTKCVAVRNAAARLENAVLERADQATRKKLFHELGDNAKEFQKAFENNEPFFDQNVCGTFNEINQEIDKESKRLESLDKDKIDDDSWSELQATSRECSDLIDKAKQRIVQRIRELD